MKKLEVHRMNVKVQARSEARAIKEYYERKYMGKYEEKLCSSWYRGIISSLHDKNIAISRKIVLEAGCGSGSFLFWLIKHGAFPIGVDISLKALKVASFEMKKRGLHLELILADVTSLPFRSGSFDILFCAETLEHVPLYNKGFQELIRTCKKGGFIVTSTPNLLNHWLISWFIHRIILRHDYWSLSSQPEHLFHYFKALKLYRSNGILVLSVKGINYRVPCFSIRIEALLSRLECKSLLRIFGLHTIIIGKKVM